MDTALETTDALETKPVPIPGHWSLRPWLYVLMLMVFAPVGSGFVVTAFGKRTYHWNAFDVQVGIQPWMKGETRLIFSPLGEIRARTHRTPMAFNIELRGVAFEDLRKMIVKPPPRRQLEQDFTITAKRDLRDFAIRQIWLGALGGLLVPMLFRARKLRYWLCCVLAGGGFVGLVFFSTLRTFDAKGFDSPVYTGSLREANWMIALVKEAFDNAEALSEKLRRVADNLNALYGRINALPNFAANVDTINILHISDIHNNPAAVDFVRELAAKVHVDAVVDTGDLTDFGTPLERPLARGLGLPNLPYLFVAGNHDSQATVAAVRANPNAIVLNGQPVTVAGLSILGSPDPSSRRPGTGDVNTPDDALKAAGAALAEDFARAPIPPDIVCVHNPKQADPLLGKARVVLCGHVHRTYVETQQGTVVCNAGTTGGAGARYLYAKEGVPLSACLLSFARSPKPHLLFIDQVILEGSLGQYSIRRTPFNGRPVP